MLNEQKLDIEYKPPAIEGADEISNKINPNLNIRNENFQIN